MANNYYSAILLGLTLLFTAYMFYRIRRTFKKMESEIDSWKKSAGNVLSPQRNKEEQDIYETNINRTQSALGFEDAAHMVIDASRSGRYKIEEVPNPSYFEELNIDLSSFKMEKDKALCLMPFNEMFQDIYPAIVEACKVQGYKCERTDNQLIEDNNNLRRYIVSQILKSKIIIAVLDGLNPNVFYEIGLAHAIGKLVILVANVKDEKEIPTDFKAGRVIFYDTSDKLEALLCKCLNQINNAK